MKTFQEIAKKHGHCRCVAAYTDRGLVSPDCEIHDMEAAANEFAEQFAPKWRTFAERPNNPKTQVLIQHPDGSMGIWFYSVAEKWSDVHKLMWMELPKPFEYPKIQLPKAL